MSAAWGLVRGARGLEETIAGERCICTHIHRKVKSNNQDIWTNQLVLCPGSRGSWTTTSYSCCFCKPLTPRMVVATFVVELCASFRSFEFHFRCKLVLALRPDLKKTRAKRFSLYLRKLIDDLRRSSRRRGQIKSMISVFGMESLGVPCLCDMQTTHRLTFCHWLEIRGVLWNTSASAPQSGFNSMNNAMAHV